MEKKLYISNLKISYKVPSWCGVYSGNFLQPHIFIWGEKKLDYRNTQEGDFICTYIGIYRESLSTWL